MDKVVGITKDVQALLAAMMQGEQNARHGGHGGGGGDMEARVAKLEAHVEHIDSTLTDIKQDIREIRSDLKEVRGDARNDFRLLFGALIAVALGLAGLMAKGFGWLN